MATAVDDPISTPLQRLFCLTSNTTVTICQSLLQSANGGRPQNAAINSYLVSNFIGRFRTHTFVAVIQCVDEGVHDFRVAYAIVAISQTMNRIAPFRGITGCHAFVDQTGDFTALLLIAT